MYDSYENKITVRLKFSSIKLFLLLGQKKNQNLFLDICNKMENTGL